MFKTQQPYWELSEAESGKQALEMFRKAQFEVVILDIVMEEMSGIEAAYETQKIAPDTKIVIISSRYTARDASVVARLLGVNAFVDKAQAAETLIPEIKRLLAV